MCYRGDKILQEGIVASLKKLVKDHEYSGQILRQFLEQHGDKQHKISKTSVRNEINNFEELAKLIGADK
jgi:hypothetical protein